VHSSGCARRLLGTLGVIGSAALPKKSDPLAVLIAALRPTERQRSVLRLMLEGRTNAQIASETGLKTKTISNYKAQIRRFATELGYEFVIEERPQRFESHFIGDRQKRGGK